MKKSNIGVNIVDLDKRMIQFVLDMESDLNRELTISSGYRGPSHPIEAAKKVPGEHSKGLAVDIVCITPQDFLDVVRSALSLGSNRIGISRKSKFVHVGLDDSRPNSIWTY